jgi:hypothetical protein
MVSFFLSYGRSLIDLRSWMDRELVLPGLFLPISRNVARRWSIACVGVSLAGFGLEKHFIFRTLFRGLSSCRPCSLDMEQRGGCESWCVQLS